jgi:hypothetical protein
MDIDAELKSEGVDISTLFSTPKTSKVVKPPPLRPVPAQTPPFSLWNFPTKLSKEQYYGGLHIELDKEEIQFLETMPSGRSLDFVKSEVLIADYRDISREFAKRSKDLGLLPVQGFKMGGARIRKIPNYVAPRRPVTDDEWSEDEASKK